MENTRTVRALKYWVKKIPKYVGKNKSFPSVSQFVTFAIRTQIEKLERKK
jgi:hypothetical protein